jgi:hypothetical protein
MQPSRPLPPTAGDADDIVGLACTLPSPELGTRRVALTDVVDRAVSATQSDSGVILRFDGSDETAGIVFGLVMAERACCARFTYVMRFDPQRASLELRIESPPQLRQALNELYLGMHRQATTDG